MNKVLENILRTKEVRADDGTVIPLRLHISEEEGGILYNAVREVKPKLAVETGMAYGISSLYICQAMADNGFGKHIVIDPFQKEHFKDIGITNLREAGLADFVEVHQKPSHQVLGQMEAEGKRIEFAFIDGNHMFDYALVDFFLIDLLMRPNGIMVLDDTDGYSIEKLARFILKNRAYNVVTGLPVIEPLYYRPSLANRLLRKLGQNIPKLGASLKPEFMEPPVSIGITGRCTVFRKLRDDDRHYAPRDLTHF